MSEDKSQIPKYRALSDLIRKEIADGKYYKGEKLASENELAAKYKMSRQTVRQALGVLESEGALLRQRGSGTYVNEIIENKNVKSRTIGVITTYITDYIFPSISRGIEEELSKNAYGFSLGVTKNKVENENKILKLFIENSVDGIIVEGTKSALPNPNLYLYHELEKRGIPYVFFNGYYRELSPVYVITDDRGGGKKAAEYLIKELGHKRIGGIFKSDDIQGHERYAGFTEAIMECGGVLKDDAVIWYTTDDKDFVMSDVNTENIINKLSDCTAVVCYNDQIAFNLMGLFRKKGIKVPKDISVIGFDNSNISEISPIKITTLSHPKDKLGQKAAQKIINMIENGADETPLVMDMELVVKNSTAKK